MKKFKDGKQVTHPKYGEGIIKHGVHDYWVLFSDVETRMRTVGDDFYSQLEAVEDLPEVGEYAYFWDDGKKHCVYAIFVEKITNKYQKYKANLSGAYLPYSNISKTPPKFD